MENDTVRRMSEHMSSKKDSGKASHEDVIRECDQIKLEHDERVDRAVRAVTMLREKFDWKTRVEVEQEEPEELDWDPRIKQQTLAHEEVVDTDESDSTTPGDGDTNDSEEEKELEDALAIEPGSVTGGSSPTPMAVDV